MREQPSLGVGDRVAAARLRARERAADVELVGLGDAQAAVHRRGKAHGDSLLAQAGILRPSSPGGRSPIVPRGRNPCPFRPASPSASPHWRPSSTRGAAEPRRPSARSPTAASGGFGVRAERLLRLAETEAREMRGAAAADVAAMIAKAQAEAEAHRHEVEQQLIERSTALDRQARERQRRLRRAGAGDERAVGVAPGRGGTAAERGPVRGRPDPPRRQGRRRPHARGRRGRGAHVARGGHHGDRQARRHPAAGPRAARAPDRTLGEALATL